MPYRVFADESIYRAELDRIFLGASWQYLALADELPEPGDYKTTFLGETPVIVTRGEDGAIHAMVNRCAHRGNLVCLKQRGHTKDGLTCVYHAWRYDLAGNLKSVPFRGRAGGRPVSPPGSTGSKRSAPTSSPASSSAHCHRRRRRCWTTSATTSAGGS